MISTISIISFIYKVVKNKKVSDLFKIVSSLPEFIVGTGILTVGVSFGISLILAAGGLVLGSFEEKPEQQYRQQIPVEGYESNLNDSTIDLDEHFVRPHERTLPSGEKIWVDGDGDTSVDRSIEQGGGWWQR
ncbi:hypothetical protein [Neobacillus terrae]|uniref:hypothetical protein n=1 Tax=Neobacillus terrae TaxID=3034837 RepID=UPI00140B1CEE|nr:hypothetical protein [Neobacillus terrae]NHM34061.1 hypothetical protein [Neobacillus terrae]